MRRRSTRRLVSVVASQKRVLVERTALNLRELLEANIGAEAIITETGTNRYPATILGLPARSAEEQAATSPPNSGERLPEKGNLILLKTADGVKALAIDRIQDVTFPHAHKPAAASEEFRNLLDLKLDWGKAKPAKSANVGLFYLQRGVRWIPGYKVELDGKGNAAVKLQATLINELADLEDVSVNLVIGVPAFAFKDTVDPMALQQNWRSCHSIFGPTISTATVRSLRTSATPSCRSRPCGPTDYRGVPGPGLGGELGPEIGDAGKSEDLFVFTVPHVSLKRGERMVLPIAEFTLPYKDVSPSTCPSARRPRSAPT